MGAYASSMQTKSVYITNVTGSSDQYKKEMKHWQSLGWTHVSTFNNNNTIEMTFKKHIRACACCGFDCSC